MAFGFGIMTQIGREVGRFAMDKFRSGSVGFVVEYGYLNAVNRSIFVITRLGSRILINLLEVAFGAGILFDYALSPNFQRVPVSPSELQCTVDALVLGIADHQIKTVLFVKPLRALSVIAYDNVSVYQIVVEIVFVSARFIR